MGSALGPVVRRPKLVVFLFLVALWTVPGLLYTIQIYEIGKRETDFASSFFDAMSHALPVWWLWVFVTPVVVALARRFPISRATGLRYGVVHLAAAVVIALVIVNLSGLWFSITPPFPTRDRPWSAWTFDLLLSTTLHLYFWCYLLIVAAVHFFDHERRLREHEVKNARLDALAAESRMQLLTSQLRPHFLFNALNGLSTLILRGDTRAAQSMLESLASFLRASLHAGESRVVPLQEELDLVFKYLAVETVRWGDRLVIRTDVTPEAEAALVPILLLQPLVENAVRHGIAGSVSAEEIQVSAEKVGDTLRLRVENAGSGLEDGWREKAEERTGLTNTRHRLALTFEGQHDLRLQELDGGRVRLEIVVPYRTTATDTNALPETSP